MTFNRLAFHTRLYYCLTLWCAFIMPYGGSLVAYSIGALCFNWLLEGRFIERFKAVRQWKLLLLFLSFYFIHLLGMLYTSNITEGLADIETKLSLLLLPIVFGVSKPFDPDKLRRIGMSFVAGCFISFLICILMVYNAHGTSDLNNYFYRSLSQFIHPGYYSMYLSLAVIILLIGMGKAIREQDSIAIIVSGLLIAAGIGAQTMLASKAPLIATFIVILSAGLYQFLKGKKSAKNLIVFGLLIGIVVAAITRVEVVMTRVHAIVETLESDNIDKTSVESTRVRVIIWQATTEVIKEKFFLGTGTGDIDAALLAKYKEKGMTGAYEHDLNTHNEYLQVFAAVGVIGFLSLMAMLFIPMVNAFQQNYFLYFLFLVVIIINFLTESMLQTQAGCVFYAFFNSLLAFGGLNRIRNISETSPVNLTG